MRNRLAVFPPTVALLSLAACAGQTVPPEAPASAGPPAQSIEELTRQNVQSTCAAGVEAVQSLRKEVKAAEARSLDTTLVPYNSMLAEIDRTMGMMSLTANVHPDKEARDLAEACERELQNLVNDINLDRGLYEAVDGVDTAGLDDQGKRFVKKLLRDFRRAGVDKDEATRQKLAELHKEMVEVEQAFSRSIREDVRTIELDGPESLAGMPEDFIKSHPPNEAGKIVITTNYPDYFPVQTYAESEKVRRELVQKFLNRGHPANDENLTKLLKLRHQYAQTLGYENWAGYTAEIQMVKSADTIESFIAQVAKIARPRMDRDLKELVARKKKDQPDAKMIETWDRFYYVDKQRAEKFGFDARAVRPYFEFNRVTQGLMDLYGELFDLRFVRDEDATVWHPSVRAYDLFSGEERIGRFFLDMHPREGKYGHAAMFPVQTGLVDGAIPVASLVCNFPDPSKSKEPALMEHNQVVTYFHEFGHLIHHLLARGSRWVNQSGISAEWDFVEAPSQLLEEWAWEPEVLARFAKHVETGEAIPAEVVKKMRASSEFGKGIHIMRQVYYTALSYDLHARDPKGLDLLAAQKKIQEQYSPYPHPQGTHGYAGFGHLGGYSSMYYTYQWSLVLAKDIFTRFKSAGLMDQMTAKEYRERILMPGGTIDAAELVKSFLGRPHNLEAYRSWLESGS